MAQSPVVRRYRDASGRYRTVPAETLARLAPMLREPTGGDDPVRVIRPGQRLVLAEPADLVLETGSRESLRGRGRRARVPPDLPLGYHTVELQESGRSISLIVAPARAHFPAGLRLFAWAMQLYAVRSRRSWGMGDLDDLRRFGAWAAERGAGLLLLNPLHAASPVLPQQPSPYSPGTRRYLNPLYLAVHQIPGAPEHPQVQQLANAGERLNQRPLIDRDQVFQVKMRALEALYRRFAGDQSFDAFLAAEGAPLREYASFCVLAEEHGGNWRRWPARYRHPHAAEVRRFTDARSSRIRFHCWLQWQLDRQLRRAADAIPVMQDLPIGIDPDGADAWAWQDVLAQEVSVGAPPDAFNTRGQNWGLPPFIPARLRQAAYRPFIETIRGTLRHAGGLRIDHVMGLYRLFWIPAGMNPAEGAYVRNHASQLLAILALESQRAGAVVVGEDLGTVESRVREELMAAGLLSYRLLWFEDDHPRNYPEQALAAVTTHDLPTIAGLWAGSDLEAQRRLNLEPNEAGTHEIRRRLARLTRTGNGAPIPDVILRTYRVLSGAPSAVVAATLEDAVGAEERPNMPGTVKEWPNWSRPLPMGLERIVRNPMAAAIARTLRRNRNGRLRR